MVWKVAEAKQKFSELLRRAAESPQIVQNRDRLAGAVLGAKDARAFLEFYGRKKAPLREALREAQRICEEEGEDFVPPPRKDRPNPSLPGPHARRHQRRQ
jgi:antitoxin (DNA-binding transcriptional repressor) of toxin-antitoxin stability system